MHETCRRHMQAPWSSLCYSRASLSVQSNSCETGWMRSQAELAHRFERGTIVRSPERGDCPIHTSNECKQPSVGLRGWADALALR
jgi:hypothetical protein